MTATKTKYPQNQGSKPVSSDRVPPQSEELGKATAPDSFPKRFLSLMNGLMGLMVDGLAPAVERPRRSYELIVVGAGPAGTSAGSARASAGWTTSPGWRPAGWPRRTSPD